MPRRRATWARWRSANPDTKVLSKETGYVRNYGSGVVYKEYLASPDLMFPTRVGDESIAKRKDIVFGVRGVAASRAWPVAAFKDMPVINDAVGSQNLVLIGDAETRTVRAYDRGARIFEAAGKDVVTDGAQSGTLSFDTKRLTTASKGGAAPKAPAGRAPTRPALLASVHNSLNSVAVSLISTSSAKSSD